MEIAQRSIVVPRRAPRRRAQLAALFYLQLRSAVHKWKLVARDPLRRLAWAPYAATAVWLVIARTSGLHVQLPAWQWAYLGFVLPSLFFVLVAMSRAAGGRLYPSRAHAHLVGGLGLPVWLLITWQNLQRLPSMLWNLGLFGVLLLPSFLAVGPTRVLEIVVAMLLALVLISGMALVSFAVRLRSTRWGYVWTATALVLAAVVAIPLLPLALGLDMSWIQPFSQAAAWSPGGLVVAGSSGHLAADLVLLVIAGGVLAIGIAVTRNLGPELAEASYRYFTLMDSARAGNTPAMSGANMRLRDPVQRSTSTRLAGAWVLAWKTWLEIRRSASARLRLLGVAFQLVFGVLIGWGLLAVLDSDPTSALSTLLIAGIVMSMVAFGFTSGRQFGPLLRNPLFALNRDSLARRLLALMLTRQATEAIGNLATFIGVALVWPAAIPILIVLALEGRAVAIAMLGLDLLVFAWLPSTADRTMVMRFVRVLILGGLVPLGTVFALWALGTSAPDLALMLPFPILILLGWGLVTLAASKLEGNGLAVALAERR